MKTMSALDEISIVNERRISYNINNLRCPITLVYF